MDFLSRKIVPMLTEIKHELRKDLLDVMSETEDRRIRELLGIDKPLAGPGEALWVDPDDLLIPLTRLTPPPSPKHVEALSHIGILRESSETRVVVFFCEFFSCRNQRHDGSEVQARYRRDVLGRYR